MAKLESLNPRRPRRWPQGTQILAHQGPDRRLELPRRRGDRLDLGAGVGYIECVDGHEDPETAAGELAGAGARPTWPLWAQVIASIVLLVAVGLLMAGGS